MATLMPSRHETATLFSGDVICDDVVASACMAGHAVH